MSSSLWPQRCSQDQSRHSLVQTTIHALNALKNKPTKNLGLGNMRARFESFWVQARFRVILPWVGGLITHRALGWQIYTSQRVLTESWETQTCNLMLNKRHLKTSQDSLSLKQRHSTPPTKSIYMHKKQMNFCFGDKINLLIIHNLIGQSQKRTLRVSDLSEISEAYCKLIKNTDITILGNTDETIMIFK